MRAYSDSSKYEVMIWALLSFYGLSKFKFTTVNQNTVCYIKLGSSLLPFLAETFSGFIPWVFQQDNSSIHTAIETHRWLTEKQLRTLPWPSKSADLKRIENVCGFMARQVYKRRKQYSNVVELKQVIRDVREAIDSDYMFSGYTIAFHDASWLSWTIMEKPQSKVLSA